MDFAVVERIRLAIVFAHAFAGRVRYAARLATDGYRAALDHDAVALQGDWAMGLGYTALARGRTVTARHWLQEAVELNESTAPTLGRYGAAYALTFMAEAAALAGHLGATADALARARELVPTTASALLQAERGLVWAAAARGEVSTACALALDAATGYHDRGAHVLEATALHDVARLGHPEQVSGRLRTLTVQLEGRHAETFAAHAEALVRHDAGALDRVAGEFAESGALLLAAEASAEASDAHRRGGRNSSAVAAAHRCSELAAECEDARTPALRLAGDPLPLTRREREVATLAAAGLTDRAIADRLVVSQRTVHNHLHHVYAKLGISTRRQLPAILGTPGRAGPRGDPPRR